MGAVGTSARNCLQTSGMFRKKRVQGNAQRHCLLLEQSANPRDTGTYRILTKRLIDDVRHASRQIRSEIRAVSESPHLDVQNKAYRNLLSSRPGPYVDRLSRQSCNPVPRALANRRSCGNDETDNRQYDQDRRGEASEFVSRHSVAYQYLSILREVWMTAERGAAANHTPNRRRCGQRRAPMIFTGRSFIDEPFDLAPCDLAGPVFPEKCSILATFSIIPQNQGLSARQTRAQN